MKMIFNYYANKTHFHNKGFALSLVLKVRFFGTRKWPILDIDNTIQDNVDNKSFSLGIFLDLKKAYDMVDHSL